MSGYTYRWPRPALTVDAVVFGYVPEGRLEVLLIRRDLPPFEGRWALPGGFVGEDEDLEPAVRRELEEETGLTGVYLEQLATFGRPGRDPRGHTVSVAYLALVTRAAHAPVGGSDARDAAWFPLDQLPALAFDHGEIVALARERLRRKLRYSPVGFKLLPDAFTLSELQRLVETVEAAPLDKRNFRRKVEATGVLVSTGEQRLGPHRSAALYRFDPAAYEALEASGRGFDL